MSVVKLVVEGFDEYGDFKTENLLVQATERYIFAYNDWRGVFGTYETTMAAPHIWVPKLTLPAAVAVGAAAAIIKNPEITRRFWTGWRL